MIPYLSHDNLKELVINGKMLLIANNYVYDITLYQDNHPGGDCIKRKCVKINSDKIYFKQCNIDYGFHSSKSKKLWNKIKIGTIKKSRWFFF